MFNRIRRGVDRRALRADLGGVVTLLITHDVAVLTRLDNLDRRAAVDRMLGGLATRPIDPELGIVDIWTGTDQALNHDATDLLGALLASAASGALDVGHDARSRISCLRSHGWDPVVNGVCVVAGPCVDGQPTSLPRPFLTWLRDQSAARVHVANAVTDIGRHRMGSVW